MFVEILDKLTGRPVRLPATQVVVYNDQGTPIMVAGEYGPVGAQKVAHAADPDFQRTLQAFGVGRHQVVTEQLNLAAPPDGSKLITGPK